MKERLQFAHIEYSMFQKSIDIFTYGCDGNCKDCCNPELKAWDVDGKDSLQVISKVMELVTKFNSLIDRIILVGGDPVDAYKHYPADFLNFVKQLRLMEKPIYLFTRHEVSKIPTELLECVDYVKTGPYVPELSVNNYYQEGIQLATSNQHIHKVSDILEVISNDN
jgi:organic radical activating enzyme